MPNSHCLLIFVSATNTASVDTLIDMRREDIGKHGSHEFLVRTMLWCDQRGLV
jgi:hypothetical protein